MSAWIAFLRWQPCASSLSSHGNGVHPERLQIEIGAAMERPPFPEHLPQDFTPYLRQHGIDEQILPFQRFRQRTARVGVLVPYFQVIDLFCDDVHLRHGNETVRHRLRDVVLDRAYQDLPGGRGIPEVHPIERSTFRRVAGIPLPFQYPPYFQARSLVVRTGKDDVARPCIYAALALPHGIAARFRFPATAEEAVIRETSATALFKPISDSLKSCLPILASVTVSGSKTVTCSPACPSDRNAMSMRARLVTTCEPVPPAPITKY